MSATTDVNQSTASEQLRRYAQQRLTVLIRNNGISGKEIPALFAAKVQELGVPRDEARMIWQEIGPVLAAALDERREATPAETAAVAEARTVGERIEQARRNPLKWIVEGTVLEDGSHLLHGPEETFKTMLTLQLLESLATGKEFLGHPVAGVLRVGMAELETKGRIFDHRLAKFFHGTPPPIAVLPETLRRAILNAATAAARIKVIADWSRDEGLEFVAIDSSAKLFPPGSDTNRQDLASDVFSQLQQLPTTWLLAHDRKAIAGSGYAAKVGNAEIVGSGRFAQDPDVVHQMVRPDGRAPVVEFHWGKSREGLKEEPLQLYFDKVDFRLYPFHPTLHYLSDPETGGPTPRLGVELIADMRASYGWEERRAREYLATLPHVVDSEGNPCVEVSMQGHSKRYALVGRPAALKPALRESPSNVVQGCTNTQGPILQASVDDGAVLVLPPGFSFDGED